MAKVTIQVPATTANIGPGFDSFGCALQLYNVISIENGQKELSFTGCEQEYCNRDNLVYTAYQATMDRMGLSREDNLHISIRGDIPVCRGLGSSAALLSAGALGANMLHGSPLSKPDLLGICNALEGHPDNLAPALYGGLTASMLDDGQPFTVCYTVHPSIHFVAVIPDFKLSTHLARGVLPASVPFQDAVFNLSHASVLARGLELGDDTLIRHSLKDKMHQPYRKSLINYYDRVKNEALNLGALSYCISGAGPTQLCIVSIEPEAFAKDLKNAIASFAPGWRVLPLKVDTQGATIL